MQRTRFGSWKFAAFAASLVVGASGCAPLETGGSADTSCIDRAEAGNIHQRVLVKLEGNEARGFREEFEEKLAAALEQGARVYIVPLSKIDNGPIRFSEAQIDTVVRGNELDSTLRIARDPAGGYSFRWLHAGNGSVLTNGTVTAVPAKDLAGQVAAVAAALTPRLAHKPICTYNDDAYIWEMRRNSLPYRNGRY